MKLTILLGIFIILATVKAFPNKSPNSTKELHSPTSPKTPTGPNGSLNEEWEKFKTEFSKRYKDAKEEEYRKGIFANSLKKIQEHNRKYDAGEVSFKQGINHLADLTVNEYRAGYLGISKTVM